MTPRQAKKVVASFTTAPGFILTLTRSELEDLVFDTIEVELESFTGSNANRLQQLLEQTPDELTAPIITQLQKIKDQT